MAEISAKGWSNTSASSRTSRSVGLSSSSSTRKAVVNESLSSAWWAGSAVSIGTTIGSGSHGPT